MARNRAEVLEFSTTRADGLRVLVVAESFLPQINGVTNSVRRVLEHLQAEGHTAEVIAPTGPETYAGFRVNTCRGASLPFYKDFRIGLESRRRLRRAMLAFRPDVVHIASPATLGYQALKAANELGIPAVAIYQTDMVGFAKRYDIPGGCKAMEALTRRIHTKAARNLAPSTASLTQLEELGIEGLGRWARGVDTVTFNPSRRDEELRARLAPNGEKIVGYIGRLAPEKELDLFQHLADMEGIKLVFVGGGPSEDELRKMLPKAEFLGVLHAEELGTAYASLDVFVHTGSHETFGQAVQEALAAGVPVVAPNQGGPVDVVDRGAGFLFEPANGEDMKRYVEMLVNDELLRTQMGAHARRSVENRSWHAVNETLVAHYRDAIAERRGARLRRAS